MIEPGKYGCYPKEAAKVYRLEHEKSVCALYVLEAKPGRWLIGHEFEFSCGDYSGSSGPISAFPVFESEREALDVMVGWAKKHFRPGASRGVSETEKQERHALWFTLELEGGWPFNQVEQLSLF